MTFYREHTRRIKKKRSKRTGAGTPLGSRSNLSLATSATAWNVRYEVKMGVFCEIRCEWDSAIKHYEQGYTLLLSCVSEVSSRWRECKELLDVLSIKTSKLYLQTESPLQSLYQLQKHVRNGTTFPDHIHSPEYSVW